MYFSRKWVTLKKDVKMFHLLEKPHHNNYLHYTLYGQKSWDSCTDNFKLYSHFIYKRWWWFCNSLGSIDGVWIEFSGLIERISNSEAIYSVARLFICSCLCTSLALMMIEWNIPGCRQPYIVGDWFEKYSGQFHMILPLRSPNMHPLERAWDMIERAATLAQVPAPSTIAQLWVIAKAAWLDISSPYFRLLVESMKAISCISAT